MGDDMTYAEVVEGIRATLAAYTQALDDGRTDDVVATFCPDGVCDIPGMGTYEGHDALRSAFAGWKPRRPQRHLVLNPLVTDWNDHEAQTVSDVLFIVLGSSGWSIELVGRYHDTLHRVGGAWRFQRRVAEFVTPSSTSPTGGQSTKSGTTSRANRSTWAAPAPGQPHTR